MRKLQILLFLICATILNPDEFTAFEKKVSKSSGKSTVTLAIPNAFDVEEPLIQPLISLYGLKVPSLGGCGPNSKLYILIILSSFDLDLYLYHYCRRSPFSKCCVRAIWIALFSVCYFNFLCLNLSNQHTITSSKERIHSIILHFRIVIR